jgi:predicted O-linked N-acetylglucosamine transferase (SPINDLY family)
MRILAGVEGSLLWLMATDGLTMENLRAAAREAGIPKERLLFAPKLPKEEHLKRLSLCDLALDTRFVTGAATTSDALWAHVPVLTIAGNHFASRMSASILKAVGLESLVAEDRDQYEALALELGNDTQRLHAIRRQLVRNIQRQPLFDTRRFTTDLERAYAAIWENHLRGDPPACLDLCANTDKGPR